METKTKSAATAAKTATTKKPAATESKTAKAADAKGADTKPNESKPAKKAPKVEANEFKDFFVDGLKDALWAEKALLKALPKMKKAATSKKLADAFDAHINGTEEQIETINEIFEMLGEKPQTKKCDAMEGLIKETESIIEDTDKGSAIRDAGLIMAAQKSEHYEIATYGTLAAFADAMGETKVAKMLRSILKDEKQTDADLTALAAASVNAEAAA